MNASPSAIHIHERPSISRALRAGLQQVMHLAGRVRSYRTPRQQALQAVRDSYTSAGEDISRLARSRAADTQSTMQQLELLRLHMERLSA
jgi:hypothetical protein